MNSKVPEFLNRSTHLSEVELRIFLGGDTLNLNEGSVGAGVALSALVAQDAAFAVQSTKLKRHQSVSD